MSCGVCNYYWCWVCGFGCGNWWHKLAGDGALCEFINSSINENRCWSIFPKCITLTVAFLILILAPILALVPCIFVAAYQMSYNCFRFKLCKYPCIKNCLAVLLYFVLFLPLSAVFFSIAAAVLGPFYYLFVVTLIIIMIFRWIIGSKRVS